MNRAQLLIAVLIILGIFIIGSIIFIIDHSMLSQQPIPNKVSSLEEMPNGNYYADETQSSLFIFTRIERIKKDDNRVFAEITTFLGDKSIRFNIIIFDKKIYPSLVIRLSSDKNNIYGEGPKAKIFGEVNSVFTSAKTQEGRPAEFFLPLQPPPDNDSVLKCNNDLLSYLNGKLKQLNCVPFALQIAAYEN